MEEEGRTVQTCACSINRYRFQDGRGKKKVKETEGEPSSDILPFWPESVSKKVLLSAQTVTTTTRK